MIIRDSTSNHNDGTISGATWVKGDFGYALKFDGMDDYVEIPHSKSLNITEEITVAVWAKPLANNDHGPIMVKGQSIAHGPTYTFRIATSVRDMTWGVCTRGVESFSGMAAPELNKWHYYVLTARAGGPTKLYVDGLLREVWPVSPESSLNPFVGYPVRMGMSYCERYKFKGLIGEARILSYVLSDENVAAEYQKGISKYIGGNKRGAQ